MLLDLLPHDPLGNRDRQPDGAPFPMGQPGLLGLLDLVDHGARAGISVASCSASCTPTIL